ncbi:Pkinase-domain-containing protein [Polychaeton citri CBS 116435]|uniref:Pkinase-domain-containing protein n=1 Tax=Polychaeton citri CBS 116435 TaxID=1314669 RepID=A0A9P4UPZ4_9PEZI|nr:Pkinase-domain-containing protein [Polychaeton citri CBS 116435]
MSAITDPTQRRFRGSAKITDYELQREKLGEGTFGVVSKARSKKTGATFALKKILMHNEKDGFPITALREVKLLKMLSHPNILKLEEMAVERQSADDKGKTGKKRATLYMVTPYMDHDLSGMLTNPDIKLSEGQIKCYMLQLLEGLRYLHDSHILHRDMKAANILISNKGILQIADFGLARHYDGLTPIAGRGNGEAVRDYTSLVVTRWYRPPELLLTLRRYTPAIDMWGVGCVFAEMFERKPILEGRTDVDQCHRIFQLVGSPNDQNMPGWSDLQGCEGTNTWEKKRGDIDTRFKRIGPEGLDLLKSLLRLDWRKRVNAMDALQHPYFTVAQPPPSKPEDLPTYADSHELDSRRRGHEKQRALPPAPKGGTVGMGPDEWNGQGPPPSGHWQNGFDSRGMPPQSGFSRDRGLPPHRGYEDRRGAPPPGGRRPAWQQGQGPPPPTTRPLPSSNNLPPRPPVEIPGGGGGRSGPVPTRGGPPVVERVDTYIPSYSSAKPRDRPLVRDRDREGYREREYPNYDGAPPGDRDRAQRRTRSRSPVDRRREDDARRARLQDREREMYRR